MALMAWRSCQRLFVAAGLGIFAYATGNTIFCQLSRDRLCARVGELAIFCAALAGAGLGFLWFNTYPAQVFMGRYRCVERRGGFWALIAVAVRQELVFVLMAGIFVIETLSVILQVASFKLTGKRIFRMAPIHHHFELKGWPEPKVIVRFWIIARMLVLASLATNEDSLTPWLPAHPPNPDRPRAGADTPRTVGLDPAIVICSGVAAGDRIVMVASTSMAVAENYQVSQWHYAIVT